MALTHEERPLSELLRDLLQEVKLLIRQEMQLLKIEMSQKASQAGKNVIALALGGALAYAGLLILLVAATLGLALVMPGWASALIIGLMVVGVEIALLQKGIRGFKNLNPLPKKTLNSLRGTKRWATQPIK